MKQALAIAVVALIATLSAELRQKARITFNDSERANWGYTPRSRRGVAIGDLSAPQRQLLHEVLRTGLSEAGYRKANGIIDLEPILGRIEGSRFRDPDRYYFSLFGDADKAPWGWRFEGHHLSINSTVTARGTSMTPMFLGANPARAPDGREVLGEEERLGRALLATLDVPQRKRATISARAPSDIVTGTDRTFRLETMQGLPVSMLNAQQRELLLQLVLLYVGKAPRPVADAEMQKMRAAGIEMLHFAWAGGDRPRQPHYYRIHGPTILIEYDNTQNGANHIHTVWRNPAGDFGDDLLAKHYAGHPH